VSPPPSTEILRQRFRRELGAAGDADFRWKLQGLKGGAAAYTLARLSESLKRPVLVVTSDMRAAENFAAELASFTGAAAESFLDRRVHLFPEREAPPLEMVSPPAEVEAGRSAALFQLAGDGAPIVVASVVSIMQRTVGRQRLLDSAVHLSTEDEVELEDLAEKFVRLGYRRASLVEEAGEFAVRGGIVDIWPAGADCPCRVELFGDAVDSLRNFDPDDQRSFGKADRVVVLPTDASSLEGLSDNSVRRAVFERCDELTVSPTERRELDRNLAAGVRFPGVELLMSYAEGPPAWIGDHLPDETLLVMVDPPAIDAAADDFAGLLRESEEAAIEHGRFFPEVDRLFVANTKVRALLDRRPRLELDYTEAVESSGHDGDRIWRVEVSGNEGIAAARAKVRAKRGEDRFRPMVDELRSIGAGKTKLIVLAADGTQLERLAHLLTLSGITNVSRARSFVEARKGSAKHLWLAPGRLERGFRMPADQLAVVTDQEIFGERRRPVHRRRVSKARIVSRLAEIEAGDYMVHVDHGIGVYRGLKHIVAGGTEGDFIHLEYAGGDRYYLPVDRINLVEKYTGSGSGAPQVARLGGTAWARTKKRAKDSIMALARELLEIEAYRAVHRRDAFAERGTDFEEFEAHFPFEETDGQKAAIEDVAGDLTGDKPMDRVVCGDVGFGKTEVAMRGAYLAVMGGRQVAVLVPTTVLARQHFDSVRDRFKDYPVRIEMLSRFNTREKNQKVVRALAAGKVDIVVGTHRLLQRDVEFARLGLLVIDEEHRFGVKAKERIKRLRQEVDVLTMTATPIPRTLQLALTGVRDLSLIETPPVDRLAIRTYVARYEEGLVKQAIERELARGGQVFFVHNRVATIETAAAKVRALVPKARVVVAHGQMREAELEQVMLQFLASERDVLVCTSIIESGLDIPNANTILVDRADTFGLAQLYQIRGRVGRSYRRAYAYLLVPGERIITEDARRRLEVLQQLDDLGSGFRIAAHDMEIRGAGNLLGKQQSGHVAAVGFELFMQMMDEATQELRGHEVRPRVEPEIELGVEAFLPEGFISDIGERLLMYKRLANAGSAAALAELADELEDRFGPPPPPVTNFVRIMGLRPALMRLAVESLVRGASGLSVRFHRDSPVDRDRLIELATGSPRRYGIRPGGVFTIATESASWEEAMVEVEHFLDAVESAAGGGGGDADRNASSEGKNSNVSA
jgi:transcription-repair coupling factor (superfamily II helicase)